MVLDWEYVDLVVELEINSRRIGVVEYIIV